MNYKKIALISVISLVTLPLIADSWFKVYNDYKHREREVKAQRAYHNNKAKRIESLKSHKISIGEYIRTHPNRYTKADYDKIFEDAPYHYDMGNKDTTGLTNPDNPYNINLRIAYLSLFGKLGISNSEFKKLEFNVEKLYINDEYIYVQIVYKDYLNVPKALVIDDCFDEVVVQYVQKVDKPIPSGFQRDGII